MNKMKSVLLICAVAISARAAATRTVSPAAARRSAYRA